MDPVLDALAGQLDEVRSLVADLDDATWAAPSGCAGWSISDVLLHLAQTNELAVQSARLEPLTAPSAPGDSEAISMAEATGADPIDSIVDRQVAAERGAPAGKVYERWDRSARDMVAAFDAIEPATRVTWVVGEMAARSLATTRIAETWLHAGDICAGLGVEHVPTDRIWHIARLTHRTVPYSVERAGESLDGTVRFELQSPGGETWSFGPDDAPTVVRGPAADLCLVAGQRLALADAALEGDGPGADVVLRTVRTWA